MKNNSNNNNNSNINNNISTRVQIHPAVFQALRILLGTVL